MAGQTVSNIDTGALSFHDGQLDYYGKRLAAACGSPAVPEDTKGLPEGDYSVQIWDITDGQQKLIGQLKGHEGPVWKVCWAHPKFGSVLATCSYDMKVIVWKEVSGQWQKAYVDSSHTASVNDIDFGPWELGLRLACASSDGTVSVLSYIPNEVRWARTSFPAHAGGAQSVSWSPSSTSMRLTSSGCDNCVCIWKSVDGEAWAQDGLALLPSHSDWIRKVAWRPDGSSTVASGSWDRTVVIWKQEMEGQPWRPVTKIPIETGKVESLAWSVTGSILAVSTESGEVTLFKETYDGQFTKCGECSENGYVEMFPKTAPPPASVGFDAPPAAAAPGFDAPQPGPPAPAVNAAAAEQAAAEAAQQESVLAAFGM